MGRAFSCIRAIIALTAVAVIAGGCAAANNATSAQASSQSEQPYKTMYGMTSEGTTTDLYTEIFGPRQSPAAPATAVASAQPVQPVTAAPVTPGQPGSAPVYQAQPAATAAYANRPNQPQTATSSRMSPPVSQPAPVQVAQQPAPPTAEPDAPTAYGIPSGGHTTDLYTAIFGPRQSNGQ